MDQTLKEKLITRVAGGNITLALLFLKFGDVVIKLQDCLEYTSFSTQKEAYRAASNGSLPFPTFRMTSSQKAARYVRVEDLAHHIDALSKAATDHNEMMSGKARIKAQPKEKVSGPSRRTKRRDHVMSA